VADLPRECPRRNQQNLLSIKAICLTGKAVHCPFGIVAP